MNNFNSYYPGNNNQFPNNTNQNITLSTPSLYPNANSNYGKSVCTNNQMSSTSNNGQLFPPNNSIASNNTSMRSNSTSVNLTNQQQQCQQYQQQQCQQYQQPQMSQQQQYQQMIRRQVEQDNLMLDQLFYFPKIIGKIWSLECSHNSKSRLFDIAFTITRKDGYCIKQFTVHCTNHPYPNMDNKLFFDQVSADYNFLLICEKFTNDLSYRINNNKK